MADEDFFSRWSRRKVESAQGKPVLPAAVAKQPSSMPVPPESPGAVLPRPAEQPGQTGQQLTMEDVAGLTPDSDYSAFVARGVDENVKRSALKKLFSDPHFNVMDGLDVYIEDYNKFEAIPPAMLAALNHAKALLDPLSQLGKPLMPLADNSEESNPPVVEADQQQTNHPELTATAEGADIPPADVEHAPGSEEQDESASGTTVDPTQL